MTYKEDTNFKIFASMIETSGTSTYTNLYAQNFVTWFDDGDQDRQGRIAFDSKIKLKEQKKIKGGIFTYKVPTKEAVIGDLINT